MEKTMPQPEPQPAVETAPSTGPTAKTAPATSSSSATPKAPDVANSADTFSREYVEQLRGECKANRQRAEGLQQTVDTLEQERAQLADIAAEHETVKAQLERLRVATEHGLSPAVAERLKGNTAEELTADAVQLKSLFGGRDIGQTGKQPTPQGELLRGLFDD